MAEIAMVKTPGGFVPAGITGADGEWYRSIGLGEWVFFDFKDEVARTLLQNRAMHKYFEMLASEMASAGIDHKALLRKIYHEGAEITVNGDIVKNTIWRPIQEAMGLPKSTKKLATDQVTMVYEECNKNTADWWGISVPFPSMENQRINSLVEEGAK